MKEIVAVIWGGAWVQRCELPSARFDFGESALSHPRGVVLDATVVPRYGENMNLTVEIPEDLARSLNGAGGDLSRRVLEALALDEYKSGRLTKPELRHALGFATSYELDGFLKKHQVWIEYDEQDLARERASLDRLGL